MKKRTGFIVGAILTAIILTALTASYDFYRTFYANNIAVSGDMPSLKVYRSYSYDELMKSIEEIGLLTDMKTFRRAADHLELAGSFKPGYYSFDTAMSNKDIVRMLANGWQKPVKIAFQGYIRSMESFAGILGKQFETDSARFAEVLKNPEVMNSCGFEEESFIGMFIPNTYEFFWTATPEKFIERMHQEYESFWTEERRQKAESIGMTRKEVSTLAAIIIEETKYKPEMPTIAGVYINRLRKGIPLQADPTVKYALKQKGITRVLNKHLKVESPYNTYIHIGLPPGPITMPPIAAIDAVLNYQHHNYIYFCARETFDGQHNFASTLSGHLANARAYHRALNAREREKARSRTK